MENLKKDLEFTGERFVPGKVSGEIEVEHWHRYLLASEFVRNSKVLDIACGEGYGTHFLSHFSKHALGVDISSDSIQFAKGKYRKPNLNFLVGSCSEIPLEDQSIDVVVSFETIEHHDQHEEMMKEIKRVLVPGGKLIISSPDKKNYSEDTGVKNDFHVKELYREEFYNLMKKYFKFNISLGQRLVSGSLLSGGDFNGKFVYFREALDGLPKKADWIEPAIYHYVIASDGEIDPLISASFFESRYLHAYYKSLIQEILDSNNKKMFDADQRIQRLEDHLGEIVGSRSWKLTGPLRKMADIFKNKKADA